MRKITLALAGLTIAMSLNAQVNCGQAILENQLRSQFPEMATFADHQDSLLTLVAESMGNATRDEKIIIPVVFHVIHQNGLENISDAQIHSGVRIMNEDFSAVNEELEDIVSTFQDRIGTGDIEFRLATLDPVGDPTSGIDRIESAQTFVGSDASKLNPWPRDEYYNIWVTDAIGVGNAAAYAYRPPFVPSPSVDGVISNHRYVGDIGTAFSTGTKTLSHESAHFLNILHTWGSSNTPGISTNCGMDDFIGDTPNTIGTGNGCNLSQVTCNSLDNVQNFMDYSDCESMFTEGQVNRMRAALNSNTASRNDLWTNQNLTLTGTVGLTEARYYVAKNVACRGEEVQFFDESRYDATSWEWELVGPETLTSTDQNPIFTFGRAGTYDVKLTVSDGANTETIIDKAAYGITDVYGAGMPFTENFREPKEGWTIDVNESYDGFGWEYNQTVGFDDEASYMVNNLGDESRNFRDLTIAGIDVRGVSNVELSFRVAYTRFSASNNDNLQVSFSNDCGETWRSFWNASASELNGGKPNSTSIYTPAGPEDWEKFTLSNIPATWLSENAMIRFRFRPGGGNQLYIDNINVDGDYESVPYLVYPDNGAPSMGQGVTIDWRSVPGSSSYEYEVSEDGGFSSTVESGTTQATGDASDNEDTQYPTTALEAGKTYFWRVKANTNGSNSAWSETWSFKIAEDGIGIEESNKGFDLSVYPNPARDELWVELPEFSEKMDLFIYNVSGQLVDRLNISSQKENRIRVNAQTYPSGTYFLKATSANKSWRTRFIINH